MKRVILLIICVCTLFLITYSQSSGTYTAKKTNSHIVKIKYTPKFKNGFNLKPEISSTFLIEEFINSKLFLNFGYQFNSYFQIGIGGGIQYLLSFYNVKTVLKGAINFPIYGYFRINVFTSNHGITPFFEIKIGEILKGKIGEYDYYYINQFDNNSIFGDFGIGLQKNNFEIKTFFHICDINFLNNSRIISKDRYIGITLSIAHNIPFKKHSLK